MGIFLILSSEFGFFRLMRITYDDNESRNDLVLNKWFFNRKNSGMKRTISAWTGIVSPIYRVYSCHMEME